MNNNHLNVLSSNKNTKKDKNKIVNKKLKNQTLTQKYLNIQNIGSKNKQTKKSKFKNNYSLNSNDSNTLILKKRVFSNTKYSNNYSKTHLNQYDSNNSYLSDNSVNSISDYYCLYNTNSVNTKKQNIRDLKLINEHTRLRETGGFSPTVDLDQSINSKHHPVSSTIVNYSQNIDPRLINTEMVSDNSISTVNSDHQSEESEKHLEEPVPSPNKSNFIIENNLLRKNTPSKLKAKLIIDKIRENTIENVLHALLLDTNIENLVNMQDIENNTISHLICDLVDKNIKILKVILENEHTNLYIENNDEVNIVDNIFQNLTANLEIMIMAISRLGKNNKQYYTKLLKSNFLNRINRFENQDLKKSQNE